MFPSRSSHQNLTLYLYTFLFFYCCGLKAVADSSLGDESVPRGTGPGFPTLSSPLKDARQDHQAGLQHKLNELKNSSETDTGTHMIER